MVMMVLGVVSYPEIGADLRLTVDFSIVNITTHLGGKTKVIDVGVNVKIESYQHNQQTEVRHLQ
jgi:hypothetical protein